MSNQTRFPTRLIGLAWMALLVASSVCSAHAGRRFVIEVVNGQLRAQGENTGADDGAPPIRAYVNSIHDHWKNVTPAPGAGLAPFASAFLPDFEAPLEVTFSLLRDHELRLELISAAEWRSPPAMPTAGVVPHLTPLSAGELIQVESTGGIVNSDDLGSIVLSPSLPAGGIPDITMNYQINAQPTDRIHVLEFLLSATPNEPVELDLIADSDPIYVILSPDGPDKQTRLHYASLFLEEHLATPTQSVPEPHTLTVIAIVGFGNLSGRKRRR